MIVNNNTTVHLVWGKSQTGKTSTILEVTTHLINTGATILYSNGFSVPPTGDIHCILEHTNNNGKKLIYAIMSAGDNVRGLNNQWGDLHLNYSGQIDIIIGASRYSDTTPAWWNTKKSNLGFTIEWFDCRSQYPTAFAHYIITARANILQGILDI